MLMKDKNKNMAALIVSRRNDKAQPLVDAPQSAGAEVSDADEMYMLAEDMMQALEARDIRKFKDAMQAMIQCNMNQEESSEDEQGEYGPSDME